MNLRQYILGYIVANSMSLLNVAFHWLTNEYMQLASDFMQLAAAGGIGATKYIFTVFLKGNCKNCIRMGITVFKIFIWGGISSDIRWEIMFYGSAYVSP